MDTELKQLYQAITALKNEKEAERFMIDLCTPAERKALSERLEIARLLYFDKLSYRDIAEKTGASTTTVARVARFLNQEPHQGYKTILDRLK